MYIDTCIYNNNIDHINMVCYNKSKEIAITILDIINITKHDINYYYNISHIDIISVMEVIYSL
jgi:hypothetical protein